MTFIPVNLILIVEKPHIYLKKRGQTIHKIDKETKIQANKKAKKNHDSKILYVHEDSPHFICKVTL